MAFSKVLRGSAWVFGDNLDVDWEICDLDVISRMAEREELPGEEELGKQCLVRVDPDFPQKVRQGDFLVAGQGAGSSVACLDGLPVDPHLYAFAPRALRGAGIAAVICESAVATFLRNSIEAGLPVIECKGIKRMVKKGDKLEVDLAKGTIRNLTTGAQISFQPFPDFILQILEAGGRYS